MGRFSNFMQGRYGFDQYGQSLSVGVVVVWIASLVLGFLARFLGTWAAWGSTILNWIGLALLIYMLFRMLSRNHEKRRAENERYLRRRQGKQQKNQDLSRDRSDGHTYLTCGFCGQQMRVPSGKGKVAVRCPACGEKTIVNS